ncbi:50S ribosomal protein L15 [Patescibacteria group bacterium]|nr:50S ribosomal protein L15 [Patescibacteria group bacterium]MBU1472287.1 50S ribosomal protein L15 [Patescibacteria group bacterium]MBU2460462.1 50S ribosomal protein L15 [Patescibacteria group bacterium]MBU2543997.1 50S ribosomal protein L15 [Patescibacteria group bacterium]
MNLTQLPKTVTYSKKRLGRGYGSGKAKTAGRGTKGQKARGTIAAGFEGGQLPLIKRLPFLRGKGRNKARGVKPYPLSVAALHVFPKGTDVTIAKLKEHKLINPNTTNVKILGSAMLETALVVHIHCSKAAKIAIEKAGGTVIVDGIKGVVHNS